MIRLKHLRPCRTEENIQQDDNEQILLTACEN